MSAKASAIVSGPSPLARGRLAGHVRNPGRLGTIPARAGETDYAASPIHRDGDHPRSRGGDEVKA